MAAGTYPPVSPAIHVHGWSFFLWYLLLPTQAALILVNRHRVHCLAITFLLGASFFLIFFFMVCAGLSM